MVHNHNRGPNIKLQNYTYLAVTVFMNTFAEVLKKITHMFILKKYELSKVEIIWMEKLKYEGQGHKIYIVQKCRKQGFSATLIKFWQVLQTMLL